MLIEYNNNRIECFAFGEIATWDINASGFREAIKQAKNKQCGITIYLHCSGGSVMEGSVIYNLLVSSNVPVEVVIMGLCASMATIVMLVAQKITMMDNAFLMLHRPTCYQEGDAETLQETVKVLQSMTTTMAKRYAEITGKTTDEVQSLWLNGKDNWLDANEALEAGLVHEIAPNNTIFKFTKKEMQRDAEMIFERMTAKLNPNNNQMKKELIASLELQGITEQSTESEIIEALKKQKKAQDNKILELEEVVESQKEKQLDDLIEEAITAKTITESQKATYKEAGKALGIEKLKAMLPQAQASPVSKPNASTNLKALVKNQSAKNDECYDYLQRFDPEKLRSLHKEDPQQYARLAKEYAQGKRWQAVTGNL